MAAVTRKISEPDFKTKRLNIWVTQAKVWLPDGVWEKCEDASQEIPDGVEVCLGFDGQFQQRLDRPGRGPAR
jgi:phage terminase large subunit-like protein